MRVTYHLFMSVALLGAMSIACRTHSAVEPIGAGPGLDAWTYRCTIGARKVIFEVRQEDGDGTPTWQAGRGARLPLSVGEAIRIAEGVLSKYSLQQQDWWVSGVELVPLGESGADRWFYVVSLRSRRWPEADDLRVPVLMSGRANAGRFEDS